MKRILPLFLCLTASMIPAEDRPSDSKNSFAFHENGEKPMGLYIKGEKGLSHEANELGRPEVNYYIVDKSGKKRSEEVGSNLLPLQRAGLTFNWTDSQKYLVTTINQRKFCDILVFEKDSKGYFQQIKTNLEPENTRRKIAIATILGGEGDGAALEVTAENIRENHISCGDTSIDIQLTETVEPEAWVRIRYRFDAKSKKFIRLDASVLDRHDHPVSTLSNAELEKAIKKIILKKQ